MLSERPWKLERVVLLLAGILAGFFVCSMVAAIVPHFSGKGKLDENSLLYLLLLTLGLHGPILVTTVFFLRVQKISWREAFGFSAQGAGRALLIGVVAAIFFLPLGLLLEFVSMKVMGLFHITSPEEAAVLTLEQASSWITRAYLVVFAVIIAPVAEEILFRGVLYAFVKQCGFPRLALWGSSILFAAIHVNLVIFLPLVALAALLALIYEKTDDLLCPIAAHAVFNAVNVVNLYFGDDLVQTVSHWFHRQ